MTDNAKIEFPEERYCRDCAHLVGRRTYTDEAAGWKCHAPQNVLGEHRNYVTGDIVKELRFQTCEGARLTNMFSPCKGEVIESSCGSSGRWWFKYEPPYRDSVEAYPSRRKPQVDGDALLDSL